MACFTLRDGDFVPAPDPLGDSDEYHEALEKAGFGKQLSSTPHNGTGAELNLYQRESDGVSPEFLITLWGVNSEIANLVADDFPHLVRTMKEIAGLTALVGLDQQTDMQAEAIVTRQEEERRR